MGALGGDADDEKQLAAGGAAESSRRTTSVGPRRIFLVWLRALLPRTSGAHRPAAERKQVLVADGQRPEARGYRFPTGDGGKQQRQSGGLDASTIMIDDQTRPPHGDI
jgi:hypothetical protein